MPVNGVNECMCLRSNAELGVEEEEEDEEKEEEG